MDRDRGIEDKYSGWVAAEASPIIELDEIYGEEMERPKQPRKRLPRRSAAEKSRVESVLNNPDENAWELPPGLRKVEVDPSEFDYTIDQALKDLKKKKIEEPDTLMGRIRRRVSRRSAALAAAGLMTVLTWRSEVYDTFPQIFPKVVEAMDTVPVIHMGEENRMFFKEAGRYRTTPFLESRFVGSNDYFSLEAVRAAEAISPKGAARMYGSLIDNYVDHFSETRHKNRFTSLDKHTVRDYMDTFVTVYCNAEFADEGIATYQKIIDFLQDNFGARKAYEFAAEVNASTAPADSQLVHLAQQDLHEQEEILTSARGRSQLYFNQEEGTFTVTNGAHLIDTFSSRAGFNDVPKNPSPAFTREGYGRTPDGSFQISSIEHGYTTFRWKRALIPYESPLRQGSDGEIEYQFRGQWYAVTGPEATYFESGKPIHPNKSPQDKAYLESRSHGEGGLQKDDFFVDGKLMDKWMDNPFASVSLRLAGRAEMVHFNPRDPKGVFYPSHGCIHLDEEDMKSLEPYVGVGKTNITISSAAGETWQTAKK